MRLLITSGGTREPIDGVRFITNFSSGSTGAFLCDYFREKGHEVVFLCAKDSKLPAHSGSNVDFTTFKDLESAMRNLLGQQKFDGVIHLAAISDFSVDKIQVGDKTFAPDESTKISSQSESVLIHLKRNDKLIDKLKEFAANKNFTLIGFKLTNTKSLDERASAVKRLAQNQGIDCVVHNDLSEIEKNGQHFASIYWHGDLIAKTETKPELAAQLERILKEHV